jgi:hypothetical protein
MAELDDIKKQINDLNRRIGELGGTFKTNIDAYISSFGNDITAANKALSEMQKIFNNLDTDVNYFYNALKNVSKELKGQRDYNKDITKSYSALSSIANKLKYDQDGIQTLSKKELQNLQKKVQIQQTDLSSFLEKNKDAEKASGDRIKNYNKQLNEAYILKKKGKISDEILKNIQEDIGKKLKEEKVTLESIKNTNKEVNDLLEEQEFGIKKLNAVIKERLEEEIKIQKTLGISGKLVDGIVNTLNKLGIDSSFFEGIKEDMREVAKTGTSWKVLMTGIKGLASGIGEALKDPVSQLYILVKVAKFFINAALTANSQVVELGKSLGYAGEQFRSTLVNIESSSNSLFVTTKNLTEAFGELVKTIGFAYEFSADQLETQIKLTKQVGLQSDEAAQIQRYSVLTGQTSEQTYKSFLKGLVATRNQLKVGIDFRATLAEAAKVSGQLAANLGFNPERIAQAVVQAKALGLTFDQLKSATSSLLNFESSLENELKAELLTGKQLNLERARAAALQGDQVALAEELAKNIGTASEFARMNVLQQDALALSVGMTSDQLAETLRKREEALASGKSLQQVTDEEAQKALERASIQDKFNAAVEKLQSIIGNLVAGPLGSFIDSLSNGLTIITKIFGYFGKIFSVIKSIPGVGGLLSGIASVATIGALMALVTKSLTKGTFFNPMITKDISSAFGGGSVKDAFLGKKAGGQFTKGGGRVPKGGRTGGLLKGAGKFLTKGSVLGILGGLGLDYASEAAANAGSEGLAKGLGVGSGILGGAGTGALIGSIIPGIGTAIGGLIGGTLGGISSLMADDMMSEGGYGKRTLFAPEGAIRLNDNDTVIAGTDLNKPSPQSPPSDVNDTVIAGTNLNKPLPKSPPFDVNDTIITRTNLNKPPQSPLIDVSALAESINNMHNTLKQSANKPVVAYINGEDSFARNIGSNPNLGTSQNINTAYRMA